MAGCALQTFTKVDQTVWNCLVAEAQSKFGITISTPSGSASKLGVTVQWNWTSASSTLTMQCTDKPFIFGCGTVENAITSAVTGCGGSSS